MDEQQRLIAALDGITAEDAGRNAAEGIAALGRIVPGVRTADIDTQTLADVLGQPVNDENEKKEN